MIAPTQNFVIVAISIFKNTAQKMKFSMKDFFSKYNQSRGFLCGNCAFPQNFHTGKLVEITVFYAVNFLAVHYFFKKLRS